MKYTTDQKGEIAELKVALRASEKGWVASRTVKGARYDFVLDDGERLHRAQVKYCDGKSNNSDGSVVVHLGRQYRNKRQAYNTKEVDALIVYLPKTDGLYWFTSEFFDGRESFTLRFQDSKNGQLKNTTNAMDHAW